MSSSGEYGAVERVFSLLTLLSNSDGLTRKEIFQQIPDYKPPDGKRANDRMLERDLACLERIGFTVERIRSRHALYRIIRPENVFKQLHT